MHTSHLKGTQKGQVLPLFGPGIWEPRYCDFAVPPACVSNAAVVREEGGLCEYRSHLPSLFLSYPLGKEHQNADV